MKISYRHWIMFRGQALGLVWQSDDGTEAVEDDTDSVLVDHGKIVSVRTLEEFPVIAHRYGVVLDEDNADVQNLDGLEQLLELPISEETCAQILNAWNMFNDIARSVGATLDDRSPDLDTCYDKLFSGNNLASVTPEGQHYSPSFSEKERALITEILNRGRTILAANI
ncbi:hypothetical protein AL755_19225 [Arthrobacter sp. ERGS1:01]|uniref:hypothetical protein n=1 Tax=Arthrobacter sp. ERGS1:01 TaxID=1704044 RepID=UPI0006B5EE5D|nr:hypothetical protein [Arthrobacter sp. ERGS1:01]ALE07105.1 hypothetical protein AL755_19225 [Arthrobacter sp. ERGS1:01]